MNKKSIWMLLKKIAEFLAGKEGNDFYINGPEMLPPPLSPEEEADAVSNMDHDREKRRLLIEHNLRLVVYIARKFEGGNTGIEDLISIGTIGLIKAVNTYKADKKIKLATYASRCIENEILMYLRKSSNKRCDISIDEPLNTDWDGNELLLSDVLGCDPDSVSHDLEKAEDEKIIREAVASLAPREREIIELRYGLGGRKEKTQKEVADMLGISQSYISRLEKKIISRLKSEIGSRI